jgi:cytoskeletal protein CcmA (bactofilin family)
MAQDGTAPTTTIGASIVIRGKLKSDEDLVVNGRVEAHISSTKQLRVEPSGIIRADVRVHSALVSGVVVGNITCDETVELTASGRVVGDLLAPRVVIGDGAAFKGKIAMPGFEAPPEISAALLAASDEPAHPAEAAGDSESIWELKPRDDRSQKRRR